MTDLEDLINSEVEELQERDDVRAVAVVGSYARDPEADHNDIDLYIIVDGDWRKRETEKLDGVVVERFFNSMEWSQSYLEGDDWFYNYHWFTNADVRFDPENLFEELTEKAEELKQENLELSENGKQEILYSIWDRTQDLETVDVGQKRYLMNQLFDYLVRKQYLLKGEVPVKENYRVKKLKEFDGYMYKLAQDFLTSSSTLEKERKLEKMIDHVTKSLGEPGPEFETEKEGFND